MGQGHNSSIPDRVATYAVVVGVMLGIAHLAGALTEQDVPRGLLARAGIALAFIAGGCGLSWIGSRGAAAMSRTNDLSRQLAAMASDRAAEQRELLERLGGIALAVSRPAKLDERLANAIEGDGIPEAMPDPLPAPSRAAAAATQAPPP